MRRMVDSPLGILSILRMRTFTPLRSCRCRSLTRGDTNHPSKKHAVRHHASGNNWSRTPQTLWHSSKTARSSHSGLSRYQRTVRTMPSSKSTSGRQPISSWILSRSEERRVRRDTVTTVVTLAIFHIANKLIVDSLVVRSGRTFFNDSLHNRDVRALVFPSYVVHLTWTASAQDHVDSPAVIFYEQPITHIQSIAIQIGRAHV